MDAFDFATTLDPPMDGAAANRRLGVAIQWLGDNAQPEQVFSLTMLDAWAVRSGYVHTGQNEKIAALLKSVVPRLDAPSELLSTVLDQIYALGG